MDRQSDLLREKYRSRLDAYQAIARENARLRAQGHGLSGEQLKKEEEAAAAVERARKELLAAIARLGQ